VGLQRLLVQRRGLEAVEEGIVVERPPVAGGRGVQVAGAPGGDGSGAASVLQRRMQESVTGEEFERERHEVSPKRTIGRFAPA